jgi:hypothetical protein
VANTVEIIVRANAAQAEAILKSLRGELAGVNVSARAASAGSAGLGSSLGSLLSKVAIVTTAFAILTAGVRATIGAYVGYGEEIDRVVKLTGVAAEELQRLRFAVEQEHGSFEDLTGSFRFLSKAMRGTLEDGSDASALFRALGVETKNTDGSMRALNEVWLDLGESFRTVKDDAVRNAIALQLLGRSAFTILPAMMQGREEIKKLGDQAAASGKVLSAEMIVKAERIGDAWGVTKARLQGTMIAIGSGLIALGEKVSAGWAKWQPYLSVIQDALVPVLKGLANVIFGPLIGAMNALGKVADFVLPKLARIAGFIGRVIGLTPEVERRALISAAGEQRAGERADVPTGPSGARDEALRSALATGGKQQFTALQARIRAANQFKEAADIEIEALDGEVAQLEESIRVLDKYIAMVQAAKKVAKDDAEARSADDIIAQARNQRRKMEIQLVQERVKIELDSIADVAAIKAKRAQDEEKAIAQRNQFEREADEAAKQEREDSYNRAKALLESQRQDHADAAQSAIKDIAARIEAVDSAVQHELALAQKKLDLEVDQDAAADKRRTLEADAIARVAAETDVAISRIQLYIAHYAALGPAGVTALKALQDEFEKLTQKKLGAVRAAQLLGVELPSAMRKAYQDAKSVTDAIAGAFSTLFQDLITGSASFGEAFSKFFRNLGSTILQMITKIAAEQIVIMLGIEEAMRGMFGKLRGGGGGGGGGGGLLATILGIAGLFLGRGGVVNGSLVPIAMAASGMVTKRPTLAMLSEFNHQEAVVPLKGGKIPVEGGGGTPVSISIFAWDTATGMDKLYEQRDFLMSLIGGGRRANHPALRGA